MIAAYCDLADRRMESGSTTLELGSMRITARIRAVIALRLSQNRPHKEAIRRAPAALTLPGNAGTAAACTARTVDAIWHTAGDRSADISWYTKRAILAGVYSATLLYWLRDASEDDADTLAFLDRRLADVGRITSLRRRVESIFRRFVPSALRDAE
jgi:ubiquinone biosynthesis protein COQ9